jgi:hypothetical protein
VSRPVINQDLPYVAALQNGFTETAENIEPRPRFIPTYLLENGARLSLEILPGSNIVPFDV